MSDVAIPLDRFTPTERRIVTLLADGFAHAHSELKGCLDDELAEDAAVKVHVCNIRKKMPPHLGVFYDATNGTANKPAFTCFTARSFCGRHHYGRANKTLQRLDRYVA